MTYEEISPIWDECEALNPMRYSIHGDEMQTCEYRLFGLHIYERTVFPYNIFKKTTTRYLIDYRLSVAESHIIEKYGGKPIDGLEIYDEMNGAIYAQFRDSVNLLRFITHSQLFTHLIH